MTTSHTPGPWTALNEAGRFNSDHEWRVDHDGEATVCSESAAVWGDGAVVALVVNASDRYYADCHPTLLANARLIAAAPDLLAACQVAFDQTCSVGRQKDWEQIRAAIAKATGEQV